MYNIYMDRLLLPFRQGKLLNTLFLSNIFLSLHYAVVLYINSSFLSNFFTQTQVSSLYIIGSIMNIILLVNASKFVEKIGNYRFVLYTIVIEFLAMLGLALSQSHTLIGIYFLTHLVAIPLIMFGFDVFIENLIKDDSKTGSIRATYLTITNIIIAISPLIVSILLFSNNYIYVYLLSSIILIPLYFIVKRYKNYSIEPVRHINIKDTVAEYIKDKNLLNVFTSHLILQIFFAFMIVYTPIYLNQNIGFSWSEIGGIFTIMLLPFIIFEIPVGELADDKYGEKEFLTIGFIIMGLSTLFISFITIKSFWVWAVVLFITRIGASFVEISSDSYFFKKVHKDRTDVMSFFRVTRPLSFIITPVIATLCLQFIPFQYIFIIIGSIMILGTRYSLQLIDTK